MDVNKFFSNIKEEINVNKRFREQYSSFLSPDFYALDLFKPNENQVSKIIAFCLDPKETHGQGNKFLKIFLEKINLSSYLSEDTNVSVIVEESTNENRRIDIVVHFKTGSIEKLIGIENKIHKNTPDQKDQMSHYSKYLDANVSDSKDFCLLYLAPKGKKISKISITPGELKQAKENNTIKCINYSDLIIPIFKEFQLVCESERLRYFLKEVELYFNKKFKGELYMNDTKNIKEIIKGDFETAFEINRNIEVIKNDLKQMLLDNIEAYVNENIKVYLNENIQVKDLEINSEVFSFRLPKWNNYKIGYQFYNSSFFYGIILPTDIDIKVDLSEIRNHNELNSIDWKEIPCWPMSETISDDLYNDSEFWKDLTLGKDSSVYKKICTLFKVISENFNNDAY